VSSTRLRPRRELDSTELAEVSRTLAEVSRTLAEVSRTLAEVRPRGRTRGIDLKDGFEASGPQR
jgi:hypothetical protein